MMSDIADRADIEIEREKQRELNRIAQSLEESGIIDCIDCGDEIPEARRKVMPSAKRCMDCEDLRR